MRVVCVQPARDAVMCGAGPVRIGSAPDDDIVLAGAGVAPHHLSIVSDARGLVLRVAPGSQRVYVNARVVREGALLHFGDMLTVGSNRLLVTSDDKPRPPVGAVSPAGDAAGAVSLRIVSGPGSGRALAANPDLHLGQGSRHFADLPFTCRIVQSASGLAFESGSAAARVNGWHCQRAALGPDDQITLGEHRLLVEAPGMQFARHAASWPAPPPPPAADSDGGDESVHAGIWWLIAAAAVLAAVIALVLYFHE